MPFSPDGNLGSAYNRFMDLLPEDGWACFLDHDAIWTTPYWYGQIARAISGAARNVGAFTAVTNRIANVRQIAQHCPVDHDMLKHRRFGMKQVAKYGDSTIDITNDKPLSGVVIVLSKIAWRKCGPIPSGFLGVDNQLHASLRQRGFQIFLLPGVYVYHWYRGDGSKHHIDRAQSLPAPKQWW